MGDAMNTNIHLVGAGGEKSFPVHRHTVYEILYYMEGEGVLRTANGDIAFEPGAIILLPPELEHGTISKEGFRLIALNGDFDNMLSFTEPLKLQDNIHHDARALVRMIYSNRIAEDDYLNALISAYLHFVLKNAHPEEPLTEAVRRIATTISENYTDGHLSIVGLLNESGYAEDYIRSHFKRVIGKTPTEFLTSLRIHHAAYLIEVYRNAFSLMEVSERCGFNDYVYFSKKFKKQMRVSPKEYKKQYEVKEE